MGSCIVSVLPDGTPLDIESGKLEQFFLKHSTVFGRQLGKKYLIGVGRVSRVEAPVLDVMEFLPEKFRCDFQGLAQIGRIQFGNLLHDDCDVVGCLVIDQQFVIAVVDDSPAGILYPLEKGVAVGILLIVLAHDLQGEQAYKINQYNDSDGACNDVFPLFKVVISFHYFFLLTESTHKIKMSVMTASLAIFSNNICGRAKENISSRFRTTACNSTITKVYRKKGANPI